jgi:hypothetical protein
MVIKVLAVYRKSTGNDPQGTSAILADSENDMVEVMVTDDVTTIFRLCWQV